jgi:hypothetical protein
MDGLQLMAIGVEDEGRIIGRAIFRPQSRLATIGAAGAQSGGMERVYRLSV